MKSNVQDIQKMLNELSQAKKDLLYKSLGHSPSDAIQMESLPADYLMVLVNAFWPNHLLITRKPINHFVEIVDRFSGEVLTKWSSNKEAYLSLIEDALKGKHGPSGASSGGLGLNKFQDYQRHRLALLRKDMLSLYQEMKEWVGPGEGVKVTTDHGEMCVTFSEKPPEKPREKFTPLTDQDKMPWGKYAGAKMEDVPAKYLHWLWTEGEKKEEVDTCPVADYIKRNQCALSKEYYNGIW